MNSSRRSLQSFHPCKFKKTVSGLIVFGLTHCSFIIHFSMFFLCHSMPMIFHKEHASISSFQLLPFCFNSLSATFAFEDLYIILSCYPCISHALITDYLHVLYILHIHIQEAAKKDICWLTRVRLRRQYSSVCHFPPAPSPLAIFCLLQPPLLLNLVSATER